LNKATNSATTEMTRLIHRGVFTLALFR